MIGNLRAKYPTVVGVGEMPYDALYEFIPMFHAGGGGRWRKYASFFQHLSAPAPGRGSSGVHEAGFQRFNPDTLGLNANAIPTLQVVDDTFTKHRTTMAAIIAEANAARGSHDRRCACLRERVREAYIELFRCGLARFMFGNAKGVDRERGLIVIKPSWMSYDVLKPGMLVVTDMDGTAVVEGTLCLPSRSPETRRDPARLSALGGVVHTYLMFATVLPILAVRSPALGTTHADYFNGAVPVTKALSAKQIATDYELNTGHAIVTRLKGIDPLDMPAVLVRGHASFCWGARVSDAVNNASYLEEVATMAYHTPQLALAPTVSRLLLLAKHFRCNTGLMRTTGNRERSNAFPRRRACRRG